MAGRPRIYTNADALDKACDSFFAKCLKDAIRPTVTGLALHLGFASKQSLYDYEKQDEFSYPIKKSLLKIENALELKLTEQAVTGVIFALKNMGWKDKTDVEQNMTIVWDEDRSAK